MTAKLKLAAVTNKAGESRQKTVTIFISWF